MPTQRQVLFKPKAFAKEVLDTCEARGLNRLKASLQVGLSTATFYRLLKGNGCTVETYLRVRRWLDEEKVSGN